MTAATKADRPARVTREIVCTGMRVNAEGKVVPEFREVLDGDAVGERSMAWARVKATAGNCYTIDAETDAEWEAGTAYIRKDGRLPMTRIWPDRTKRAAWQAAAEAVIAEHKAKKALADQARRNEIDELCRPLAAVYRALAWSERSAFLIAVQERIVAMARKPS